MKNTRTVTIAFPWPRVRQYRPWQGDLALALAVAAIEIVGTHFTGQHNADRRALDAGGIALLAAGAAALVFRRRYPVEVLLATEAAFLSYWFLHCARGPVFLALIVAFISAAFSGRRVIAWSALAAGLVAFIGLSVAASTQSAHDALGVVYAAGWLLALGGVAEIVRTVAADSSRWAFVAVSYDFMYF